jgi:hypothetical protein
MYAPAPDDEITGLAAYIDQQLDALRAAIVGLTEDQARQAPCTSALSIGGLLKHATYCLTETTGRLTDTGFARALDEEAYARYQDSFALGPDETGAGALEDFDEARIGYLAAIARTDPDADITEPPAPWHGIFDARPAKARYLLVHQIEELARHAGHADIIREQIDGTAVPVIAMSLEGTPASDVFQPYVAPPRTIGA